MNKEVSIKNVIKMSGAFIAYLIGSGFATGQEIMQFFASFGINGLYGIAASLILFATFGSILMMKGHDLQLENPSGIFSYYTGNFIGKLIEIFTIIFIFSVVVIMISGSGAIANEHFGLPYSVGSIGMGILAMITVILGLEKLVDIIGFIGPVIVIFTIFVGTWVFFRDISLLNTQPIFDQLPQAAKDIQPTGNPILSGILFFCYNILAGTVFFTQLGKDANSRKEAGIIGLVGGVGLMLAVLFMVVGMLTNYESVITSEVPNLILGGTISPLVATLYAIVIILGVYSTTAPMYWIIKKEAMRFLSPKFETTTVIGLGILFILGGLLPFGVLVGTIYPMVGYVGLAIVIVIIIKSIFNKYKMGHI